MQAWLQVVGRLRTELFQWTQRQSKHAAMAYPLVTYLVCLEDTSTFAGWINTLVENLHRLLKVG